MIFKRAQMMGIDRCHIGDEPKLEILNKWCEELEISLEEVAYLGDDINDMDIIGAAGISACPSRFGTRRSSRLVMLYLVKKEVMVVLENFMDMFFLNPSH